MSKEKAEKTLSTQIRNSIPAKIVPANLKETEFCLDYKLSTEAETITRMVKSGEVKMGEEVILAVIKNPNGKEAKKTVILDDVLSWLDDHAWEYVETEKLGIENVYTGFDIENLLKDLKNNFE